MFRGNKAVGLLKRPRRIAMNRRALSTMDMLAVGGRGRVQPTVQSRSVIRIVHPSPQLCLVLRRVPNERVKAR